MKSILEDSKTWMTKNSKYLEYNRWEGLMDINPYNTLVSEMVLNYENIYKNLTNSYLVGFEIEFYIKKNTHNLLLKEIIKYVPKEKMIIENINDVIPSDGEHFFLIKDRTGKPASGYVSLELISPTFDSKLIPYFLKNILIIIEKFAKDDEHIGLHFHVSTPKSKRVSPISLLACFEKHNLFDWKEREFVRNIFNQFFEYDKSEWKYIYENIIRKCYTVNFLHFHNNNRIEYRAIGGKNYLSQIEKIMNNFFGLLKSYEMVFNSTEDQILNILQFFTIGERKLINLSDLSFNEFIKLDKNNLWIN